MCFNFEITLYKYQRVSLVIKRLKIHNSLLVKKIEIIQKYVRRVITNLKYSPHSRYTEMREGEFSLWHYDLLTNICRLPDALSELIQKEISRK